MSSERYVPAAGRASLTGLYDPVMALTMRERRFRRVLVERLLAEDPGVILDVGCGTGTLAVELARSAPRARLIGLDGDPGVLWRAAEKARAARVKLELLAASATAIPLADASVDGIVSSLVLHHLSSEAKQTVLWEVRRVLRPHGLFLLADWGKPGDPLRIRSRAAWRFAECSRTPRHHAANERCSHVCWTTVTHGRPPRPRSHSARHALYAGPVQTRI
jgi:ubiquinone/menaquinone biosynthesis C-methylase UbiE